MLVVFNGKEYLENQISKSIFQCHTEDVDVKDILPSLCPDAERPIVIKFNGKYQILVGTIKTEGKEKVKLNVITKHVLKKCEVQEEVIQEILSFPLPTKEGTLRGKKHQGNSQSQVNAERRYQKRFN